MDRFSGVAEVAGWRARLTELPAGQPGDGSAVDGSAGLSDAERVELLGELEALKASAAAAQARLTSDFDASQRAAQEVYTDAAVKEYIVLLAEATRSHEDVYLGVSPRGSLALFHASRALAAMRGRDYVLPDDIKELAGPALAHRLIVSPAARMKNIDGRDIVEDLLALTPVPGARAGRPR